MKRIALPLLSLCLSLGVCLLFAAPAWAQKPACTLPAIVYNGSAKEIAENDLLGLQKFPREQFARKDAPDEMFVLAEEPVGDYLCDPCEQPRTLWQFSVYGREGELRCFANGMTERYFHRRLSAEEVDSIRTFVSDNQVDSLPALGQRRTVAGKEDLNVGGTAWFYLRMSAERGLCIPMMNPPCLGEKTWYPAADPIWKYARLIDFFEKLSDPEKFEVYYDLPRPLPGLEVVFAHPQKEIRSVWRQGDDLCVRLGQFDCAGDDEFRRLVGGKLGDKVPDPKLFPSRPRKVGDSAAEFACSSPDGRWVLGLLDKPQELACYDSREKKSVPIEDPEIRAKYLPMHFVEARRAFLLARFRVKPIGKPPRLYASEFRLFDPAAGKAIEVRPHGSGLYGEGTEPWYQELPRQLQFVKGQPNVFWAAQSENCANGTYLGRYDCGTFGWLGSTQLVPCLALETKDILVDEGAEKVYAVYKGHLLRFPLQRDTAGDDAAQR